MVSFQCEGCGDVFTKKKLDPHRNQCRDASFSCLDCMVHFEGTDYRSHTSCISEAQKYQGALYRPDKKGQNSKAMVPHAYIEDVPHAYVEDAPDTPDHDDAHHIVVDPPPHAPSPPPAVPDFEPVSDPVNVFDFLVDSETPNASRLELPAPEPEPEPMNLIEDVPERSPYDGQSQDLTRVRFEDPEQSLEEFVEYGSGPVHTSSFQTPAHAHAHTHTHTHNHAFQTPAPKGERERKKDRKDREQRDEKKDKKRKRLHVETQDLSASRSADEIMTDAPPVLHSGLTGGLGRLLSRPSVFPPSPDYSGDAAEASPASPLKKSKHSNARTISNNLMSLISTRPSTERPKRKHAKSSSKVKKSPKTTRKMLEYKPLNESDDSPSQMVVYKPRAELLLSLVNKGPESERGVSMNKALKRYHRERVAKGNSGGTREEEKELWRSLRMKRNDRGEIVLFL
ncbi:hypothetical protein B7494_g6486 [Chlorociboria aeruginascens]|nr:hypothetical protein B7494_g6486 [Chlorociboria aeruginascens]